MLHPVHSKLAANPFVMHIAALATVFLIIGGTARSANAQPTTSIKLNSCLRMRIPPHFFGTSSGGILSLDVSSAYHSYVALLSCSASEVKNENS